MANVPPAPKPAKGGGLGLGGSATGPAPPPPPPSSAGKPGKFQAFVAKWGTKYPGLKTWAADIDAYARENKIDPIYLASVLITESGVSQNNPNGTIKTSSVGALGLGQIMPVHVGSLVPWDPSHTLRVTLANLHDPVFNLHYSAYLLGLAVKKFGYQDAYAGAKGNTHGAYNPGWTPSSGGTDPLKRIPNGYLPGVTSPGNTAPAPGPANVKDPWVVLTKDRKGNVTGVSYNYDAAPPKNALSYDGHVWTHNDLVRELQDANGLGSTVFSLTGRNPTLGQVAAYLGSGNTITDIENYLIDQPGFANSPTGKKYQAAYQDTYSSIMGLNEKVPLKMVQTAAKSNLSPAEFAAQLRQSSLYLKSNEYTANVSGFSDSYERIYGPMDGKSKQLSQDAALAGWSQAQWDTYLRSQPGYTRTQEYKSHALDILDQLGLTFGFLPTLQPGANTAPVNPATADPSPQGDKRVAAGAAPQTPQASGAAADLNIGF